MTAIAAIVEDGKVWMGGDSAGSIGDHQSRVLTEPKVFINGDFLIGITGSHRTAQLFMCAFAPPEIKEGFDTLSYFVNAFIPAMKSMLKEAGHMKQDDGQDIGYELMVGVMGKLFTIYDDFQVTEFAHGYHAIGCGDDLALGSLFTTSDPNMINMTQVMRINLALQAAAEFNAHVREPFVIKSI